MISLLHRRFPVTFTPSLVSQFATSLARPQSVAQPAGQAAAGTLSVPSAVEQKEKDDASRVARQRPVLRVCSELALVGIIKDGPDRSGAEWIMKTINKLVRQWRFSESHFYLTSEPIDSFPMTKVFLHCHY